jgi:hypothetical protein
LHAGEDEVPWGSDRGCTPMGTRSDWAVIPVTCRYGLDPMGV